jgi:hypothetical protein
MKKNDRIQYVKFRDLSIEEQAKQIMEHLKINLEEHDATEEEVIDEIIERIILPVRRKRRERKRQ